MVLWEQVEAAELDEMWSFVGNKGWLWLAIDRKTRAVLAYVFGQRKDKVFMELKALLEPFGIKMFHTDGWGSYLRNIAPGQHIVPVRPVPLPSVSRIPFSCGVSSNCYNTTWRIFCTKSLGKTGPARAIGVKKWRQLM